MKTESVAEKRRMSELPFGSFQEFWPQYVREHYRPGTRALHFLGLLFAVAAVVIAAATGQWLMLLAAPVLGYGFAWAGHLLVERNIPATFRHPIWSIMGDLRMCSLMLVGRMAAEVMRCGGVPLPGPRRGTQRQAA